MTMSKKDLFDDKFTHLSTVLAADFYDSADSVEEIARGILCDADAPYLRRKITEVEYLVEDCHEALEVVDEFWQAIASRSGAKLHGPEEAREWLVRMTDIWETWLRQQEPER